MAFVDTRFPTDISYGASGGPGYSTDVVVINSGFEQRNINWDIARAEYDVVHGVKTQTQLDALIAFFRTMKGRANGFRFKDWTDYAATIANGILGTSGIGTGAPTYQLYKKYTTASETENRAIKKPVSTVVAYRNASPITVGASAGNIAIDYTTGIVTFVADSTKSPSANSAKTITGITQANPGVVTATAHDFTTGDKIRIASVVGMTQVNNLYFTITSLTANTFSIGVNTTAYTAYSSAGTATKYGITQTSTVTVYSASHGFTNGQVIYISGVVGMTEVNGLTFTVANTATNSFDLSGISGTAYTAYTSGGTIGLYPQAADALTWAGEFDVPCRFDIDQMKTSIESYGLFTWGQIPIIEIRV